MVQDRANPNWYIIWGQTTDGKYLLGSFNGTSFIPDSSQKIPMDYGANFYAVYTYGNIAAEDGRTIQLA